MSLPDAPGPGDRVSESDVGQFEQVEQKCHVAWPFRLRHGLIDDAPLYSNAQRVAHHADERQLGNSLKRRTRTASRSLQDPHG